MFRAYGRVYFILLGFLFWTRLIFLAAFFRGIHFEEIGLQDWFSYLLGSIRFDLLVAGYSLLPTLLILLPCILIQRLYRFQMSTIRYSSISMLVILSIITFIDFQHYMLFRDRLNSSGLDVIRKYLISIDSTSIVILGVITYLAYFSIKQIWKIKFEPNTEKNFFKWAVMILITGLCIRGSLGQHHLDLRHAEVTNSEQLNKMIIPSAYALDQALRDRR